MILHSKQDGALRVKREVIINGRLVIIARHDIHVISVINNQKPLASIIFEEGVLD
jgi:hypothetical protein